jgi:energy-coupling factor transport system permease protein
MIAYRRRRSPLHAARASAGCAYCGALALAALVLDQPALLLLLGLLAVAAGALAGVGRELRRAALLAVPLALLAALVNPLVAREGLTVIARLGEVPVLGQLDITLEATVYGAVQGLRIAAVVLAAALYTAAVDPDEVLRLLRRVSFRSALTATLATRLVPVLARDGRRIADAQRCRPGPPPGRVALVRATTAGALDRAVDVAAALEVRGYAGARRPRRAPRPWSRPDLAFAASAAALAALAIAGRAAGWAAFDAYPRLHAAGGPAPVLLGFGLLVAALAPFLVRRGLR